jgi:hypothetical protein
MLHIIRGGSPVQCLQELLSLLVQERQANLGQLINLQVSTV